MKFLGNILVFVTLYILFMIPTYLLPYLGSNSIVTGVLAADGVVNPTLWLHLGALVALVFVAWFRGLALGKGWLVTFPILAGIFDFIPILNWLPLVPTVFHLVTIIVGVTSQPLLAEVSERRQNDG